MMSETSVRLTERMAESPEAFDFSDIAEPRLVVKASLETMLGGFCEELERE